MAPFQEAIQVRSSSTRGEHQVYFGTIDPEWAVGAYVYNFLENIDPSLNLSGQSTTRRSASQLWGLIPGAGVHIGAGYVLALLVDACIQYQSQSNTGHRDPIHVTAHFLRTTAVSPFEIQIRMLKSGRGFTNIAADLVQRVRLALLLECSY
jgi:Thioesterase-like superfamily